MPYLIDKRKGKRTYLDSLDNKNLLMHTRRIFQDQDKNYDERESAIHLDFSSMLLIERLRGDHIDTESIIKESWEIDRPTNVRIGEETLSEINE
ncbi:MAG: hypothetical protein ACXAB7_09745 [Candidatus Kariarchaeaceae archaeon]|jgi:hypothetical protein